MSVKFPFFGGGFGGGGGSADFIFMGARIFLTSVTFEPLFPHSTISGQQEATITALPREKQTCTNFRGQKINTNFFGTKFFKNPSGHGRLRQKSWTSAPKSASFCGPGDGEKLFDPGSSGHKGQECPREIRTKKFMFMLFFLP